MSGNFAEINTLFPNLDAPNHKISNVSQLYGGCLGNVGRLEPVYSKLQRIIQSRMRQWGETQSQHGLPTIFQIAVRIPNVKRKTGNYAFRRWLLLWLKHVSRF